MEESEKKEKKKEDQKRESLRRKKIQVREKVGKSRNTVFPMICGSGGSKSRLAKAVVARSTFPSQNVQNTSISLLEVEMSKKCTSLWCEAHLEIKMEKKTCSDHFWTFRCCFAWQARGIMDLVKSEQNVRVL